MNRLLIFTRWPQAGRAKTRLIPALGPDGAAQLSGELTRHCLAFARRARERWPERLELEVRFEGGSAAAMAAEFGDDVPYVPQGSGDLGERLLRSLREAWESGCRGGLVIGTDCPALTDEFLGQALDSLERERAVLGPARDGGYTLLGLPATLPQAARAAAFENIAWSTDAVADQTRAALASHGVALDELTTLDDVDRPEDLAAWERRPRP
ncbi:MAG: TIGR04282 family arsenosugar biosynthesis glycosyltransferase [Planctomycetota bacterium]